MTTRTFMGMPLAVAVFFSIDLLLVATYLINAALGEPIGGRLNFLINLDREQNIPAWYSSVKLFLIGYLLLSYAQSATKLIRKSMTAILVLAIAFVFMSLDEIVEIHEKIGIASDILLPGHDRVNSIVPKTGIWMFILLIPACALMLYLLNVLRSQSISARTYKLFVVGLAIFAVSAGGIELLSNYAGRGALGKLQISAEELGEMIGATIMLWATFNLLGEADRAPPELQQKIDNKR